MGKEWGSMAVVQANDLDCRLSLPPNPEGEMMTLWILRENRIQSRVGTMIENPLDQFSTNPRA
jgi:hypothetical protein